MRAASKVVALSSLLAAASVAAGPSPKDKPTDKAPAAKAGGKAGASAAPSSAPGAAASADATQAGPGVGPGAPGGAPGDSAAAPTPSPDLAAVKPEDMPTAVRMRRLEQKTQALKERAWQLKARVQMLKEQMIGGGVGAQAVIGHSNEMGASFRLIKLVYALDGTQVFARTDDTAESLYKARSFDVFAGPISPGNHTISAVATYRGHGYGVFEYLSKYTFTARGNQAFIAGAGKISRVDCHGFEKGGPTMPLEKRAAVECKVTQVQPDRPAEKGDKPDAGGRPGAPAPAGSSAPAGSPPGAAGSSGSPPGAAGSSGSPPGTAGSSGSPASTVPPAPAPRPAAPPNQPGQPGK
jgi:hypothetical protein